MTNANQDLRRQIAQGSADEIFRVVVEATPNAIVLANAQGRILLVNAGAEKLFGYPRGELIGQPVEMLLPERFRAAHPGYRQAYASHAEVRAMGKGRELFARRKDGSEVPVEIGLNPIETPDGPLILSAIIDITERKQMEEARRLTEARYRALFEYAPDGIVIADSESCYIDANASMCQMLGYTREEFIGLHASDIVAETESEHVAPALSVIKAGADYHREWRFRRKDGSVFVADVMATQMPDGNLLGLIRDISDRKRAEVAAAHIAAIVESSDDAIIGKDLTGIVTSWNAGAENIFGYPEGEMVGQSITRLLPPERQHEEVEILDRIRRGECVRHFDTVRLHKTGRPVEVSVTVSAIKDSAGKIVGASKVARDISERKKTEDQLRGSLKEIGDLKAALDEHAIVAMTDPQGKITYVNDKFCAISKYAREELLGQDHRIINSGYHPKEFIRELWTTIAHGKVWKGEIKNRAKDGSFYWVDTTIVPFLNEQGKPRQYVAIRADITERKKTEDQLRGSFKEVGDLKAALDEHAIVAMTDPQGRITYVNDKFCAISKYAREELLGQDHRLINSGYHPTEFIRDLWMTITHGRVWHGEIKNRAKDGSFYWVDTTIVPFLNEQGKPRQYVAIRADITERKQVEEQLRASLKEIGDLKAALDEHAIVAMTDPQGRITYVNDKFCAISKYSREELLGQDHRIINSGYHPTEFIRDLWTTITHGRVWHGEIKNRAKDGSFYWVDTTIVPFLNERGKPRQYVAIRADITERKRTEEQLRASLKEIGDLKAALDEHAIVAITDPQGRIIYVNNKFCAISKYSREELLGQDHRIINSGYHPTEFIRDLWMTITHGRVWKGEIKNRAKDGSFYWVDTTIVPFLNDQGKPRQYVAIRADITERKRAEEALRQLNAELEERVAQRTKELEVANKELEAFSYSVSHDLRAPLRAIDGFSQAALEDFGGQLPEEGRYCLQTIREGAQQMGMLIDDLLTFSRLSRAPLQKQEVNTAALVREVFDCLGAQREGRQIDLRLGELPVGAGDPALLKQVWVNLLSNAFKYTRKRDLAVVEIGCQPAPEGDVYFVRDNGTGFDMRYVHKLFGVFQRLHRAEDYEGTGVGLALVQRIIHRHGGRVWAEAAVDRGATFYFTLETKNLT